MKKSVCLLCIAIVLLCVCGGGCTRRNAAGFTAPESGILVSASGTEYRFLANEGALYYLGELEFIGGVQGEKSYSQHLGLTYQTGLYGVKGRGNDNILIRLLPDNEWFSIYRKASLPEFVFSADNCVRLEFVKGTQYDAGDVIHKSCGEGITAKTEIAAFLSDVRSQPDPRDAGLYEQITKADGTLENCYIYGWICGFFEEEPELVIRMAVTSFNDNAYSVSIGEKEYVLPEKWLQMLQTEG